MKFHHTVLDNGLHVIAELSDQARSVAAGFFVKAGSRDEGADVWGVSHFLEHMVFKGTGRRDALAVSRELDRVGARHNAQTSEEDTFYHVTCLPEYLPKSFDVLADILRPALRQDDFDTEKKVIIEEIHMYQDNPMSVCWDAAKALHYGEHPLGKTILGSVESIEGLTLGQMKAYFEAKYSPTNIVLAFAGKTDWNRLVDLANEHCGAWTGVPTSRQAAPARGSGKFQAILRESDLQQTVIGLADGPPQESDDRYAAQLLATVVGDHVGSRLYWSLIDPGAADAAELAYHEFNQAGLFFTFLSCVPEETQENLQQIVEVYREVMDQGVSEEELARAKNKVLSRTVIRSEKPMGRLSSLGFHWTYRREHVSVEQELDAYGRVTLDDLRRVAREWPLLPLTLVSVGPTTEVSAPEQP